MPTVWSQLLSQLPPDIDLGLEDLEIPPFRPCDNSDMCYIALTMGLSHESDCPFVHDPGTYESHYAHIAHRECQLITNCTNKLREAKTIPEVTNLSNEFLQLYQKAILQSVRQHWERQLHTILHHCNLALFEYYPETTYRLHDSSVRPFINKICDYMRTNAQFHQSMKESGCLARLLSLFPDLFSVQEFIHLLYQLTPTDRLTTITNCLQYSFEKLAPTMIRTFLAPDTIRCYPGFSVAISKYFARRPDRLPQAVATQLRTHHISLIRQS